MVKKISAPSPVVAKPECIRLRGVRQNNLKGFDLDVPLGRYIAVTGLSGAGKSSLVFDTLHAEGQRRYVETFSAYTRQFLDLLDKPKVDSIENIRPSIAIEQTNTVKTSRSTVGTMTELTDFFKVWFSHVAECFDPTTGEKVEDDNPQSIWENTASSHTSRTLLVCFKITKPANLTWPEILTNLKNQGYVRLLATHQVHKIEDLLTSADSGLSTLSSQLSTHPSVHIIQDRLAVTSANKSRFLEATETALHFGQSQVFFFAADTLAPCGHFSRGLHSPSTGRTFRAASPALFSFNSPLGACPKCRGFGRVIDIEAKEIAGFKLDLFVLSFEQERMMLRVPVAKAKISGLRKLSSRKIMESALVTLKGRGRVSRAMWNRRAQEYEAKINSGDPVSIAEVVRDLHRNAGQPDQSYSERQIYEAALDRLARELAAVERIDKDLATQKLNSVLQKVA